MGPGHWTDTHCGNRREPKWQKVATRQKEAKKGLSQKSAALVPQRLSQLAAFENLGEIPFRAPPLHLHLLTKVRKGQKQQQSGFVIKLHGGDGIVFRPTGECSKLKDGTPDTSTVTQVEIVLIGNCHGEPPLKQLCAEHGVAVVFVPHLPKSYVSGAAYRVHDKAVIQLSLRYCWADIFWFNFFHELGHVLLHLTKRNASFVDDREFTVDSEDDEFEANEFAATTLIPEDDFDELLSLPYSCKELWLTVRVSAFCRERTRLQFGRGFVQPKTSAVSTLPSRLPRCH